MGMNNSLCDLIGQEMPFDSFVLQTSVLKTFIGDSSDDTNFVMVEIFGIKCQNSIEEVSKKLELMRS
jgi:hypothetical protein